MKKFFIILFLFTTFSFVNTNTFAQEFSYDLTSDLNYAENQAFHRTFTDDDIETRLERLEISTYGAIQKGDEAKRIKRIRKSLTSISQGGFGLNNSSNIMNLAGTTVGNFNRAIGYSNSYYYNSYHPNHFAQHYSHRLPPCRHNHYHSHRLHPSSPHQYSYNGNPYMNGDFLNNYSIGTGIKILDD